LAKAPWIETWAYCSLHQSSYRRRATRLYALVPAPHSERLKEVAGLLVLLFPGGKGLEVDLLLLLQGQWRRFGNVRMRETSSEKFEVGERSRAHSTQLEAGLRKTGHEDGGKQTIMMWRLGIRVMETESRCKVVEGDRPVDRTWSVAGGAERCLGRSA
jgi:hypothetical protein